MELITNTPDSETFKTQDFYGNVVMTVCFNDTDKKFIDLTTHHPEEGFDLSYTLLSKKQAEDLSAWLAAKAKEMSGEPYF